MTIIVIVNKLYGFHEQKITASYHCGKVVYVFYDIKFSQLLLVRDLRHFINNLIGEIANQFVQSTKLAESLWLMKSTKSLVLILHRDKATVKLYRIGKFGGLSVRWINAVRQIIFNLWINVLLITSMLLTTMYIHFIYTLNFLHVTSLHQYGPTKL